MSESLKTRITRWGFNLFPALRRTGMRITYVASDWLTIKIKLPLNWKTKNYHGTMFGGSMYGAIDPIYFLILTKALGNRYIVWDKSASIRFKKPARTTLYTTFKLELSEIEYIKSELVSREKIDRTYQVDLFDSDGTVYASFEKVLHIRNNLK